MKYNSVLNGELYFRATNGTDGYELWKSDGTEVEWTAVIDGTDHLKYTTLVDDFSVPGTYFLQASLTLGGWSGLGETAQYIVYDPYM